MKPIATCFAAVALLLIASASTPAQATQPVDSDAAYNQRWAGGGRPARIRLNPDVQKLPHIAVQANHFVDPSGKIILFRGVSIADPDKIVHDGHWNEKLFQHIKDMDATLVRIPVHPAAWRGRTPEQYLPLLDQAVHWCTALGLYIDIDWHSIGNLKMELFQNPIYNTTPRETYEFWRTISSHFAGHNTVAFYELFNEPTIYDGKLGSVSWSDWRKINEDEIRLIRAADPKTIELIAGFDWAYDLTPLRLEPIAADGIAYVTHPYANKRTRPWEPKWEEDFGFAADKWPLIATEIGFSVRPTRSAATQPVSDDDYGNRITRYLESRGISWIAWAYDPNWGPQLLKSWNYDLTPSGEFFKMAMGREVGK